MYGTVLVGHVPMELSFLIFTFLKARHENNVQVKVTGSRRLENGLVVPGSFLARTTSRAIATKLQLVQLRMSSGTNLVTGKKNMQLDISLPTEHLGVLKKSSKRVRAFQIEMEFGVVYFWGEGKPKYTEKNLSEQGREPTTNSTNIHAFCRRQDSNPDHIGRRRVLSPLRHSAFLLVWSSPLLCSRC